MTAEAAPSGVRARVVFSGWLLEMFGRVLTAAVINLLILVGLYPGLGILRLARKRGRSALAMMLREWPAAWLSVLTRPLGFLGLPGRDVGRPVVVIHGFGMGRASFWWLARRLAARGYGPVLGYQYDYYRSLDEAAQRLAFYLEARGIEETALVGHSLGGIVARAYASSYDPERRARAVVTLGSPHGGSVLLARAPWQAAQDVTRGSPLLVRLAETTPEGGTAIWSTADPHVPTESIATWPGAEHVVFDDVGHMGLLTSAKVADEVMARIDRPRSAGASSRSTGGPQERPDLTPTAS
jgi:predicted alpha/beta hydrolase family esterase